ncbi:sensor histidine kinase [Paenibacillus aestuarii]|uniref:Sensor histidine kinase n=1 Tax=Paenibacillus aestuarii TaxID=516965 RepID=A0ABW0K4X1_9BACL|nr:sensor histidine kinase [Paenibacillus aestuarii]
MLYSFKRRLIVFFVLLLVFSFGTMSLLLFHESRSMIRSYIESSAFEKMDEYSSFVNMALSHIYDLSSIVFNSDRTKTWDTALSDPALSAGEKMLANINMSQFLTQTTNSYSSVSSVTVYRQEGLWVSAYNQIAADTHFKNSQWYTDFMQRGIQWAPAHDDPVETSRSNPNQVVSLLMPIGTFEPTKARTMMKVNVSADFFLEPLNRIHLGEQGTIFLLDQNGQPILGQREYATHPEAAAQIAAIRNNPEKQGVIYLQNVRASSEVLVYTKLKLNNWILVGVVSEEDLFAKLNKLRNSMLMLAIVLLVLAISAATWLSHGITKPLSRLASAMRYVQKGDFAGAEQRIQPDTRVHDEVGYVTLTFRNMVSQLRYHIKTEFEHKLLRQQAEYKALLMQINPHFLFNTLELLSSLAMQKRTDDTVDVIHALGKMLRFSLRISDDVIALKEEVMYARYYISILKIRFGDKLQIELEEEGELDRLEVTKFILQPLIENAVKYSFAQQPEAKVFIRVQRDRDAVHLVVRDNGPGIAADMVEQLQAESANPQFADLLRSRSKQIGLRNVLGRCRLYYGARFAFQIDAEPGQGTCLALILPMPGGGLQDVSRTDCG